MEPKGLGSRARPVSLCLKNNELRMNSKIMNSKIITKQYISLCLNLKNPCLLCAIVGGSLRRPADSVVIGSSVVSDQNQP